MCSRVGVPWGSLSMAEWELTPFGALEGAKRSREESDGHHKTEG